MRRCILWGLILGLCGWVGGTVAEPLSAAAVATKLTVKAPMRDGTLLAADVRLPEGDGPWPVALVRTPYGKSVDGAARIPSSDWSQLTQDGVVVVVQDTRGRFASEGKARPYVDEGWGERQDGVDTVAWIRGQSWCNGKIATFGGSYAGTNQLLLAGAGPEGIVGQLVTVGAGSVYHHVFFQNGVWRKAGIESWLLGRGYPPEALRLIQQHPRYDAFWGAVDLANRPEQVHWPVVLVGGWFDLYTQGMIDTFTQLQDHSGASSSGRPHLVIGPWTHVGAIFSAVPGFDRMAGELRFPNNAIYPPDAPTQFQWLRLWLTGQSAAPADEPAVRYYVMGDVKDPQAPGNLWRSADRWPPPSRPLRLYFTADGGLEPQPSTTAAMREYDYDPRSPVPSIGDDGAGSLDQRRVEGRTDVQVFTTPPLTAPLEVTGRISVRLLATTSAQDTDFTAKLTDVYPDGRSMRLTDGIVRARYRRSVEKEEPVTPGQRYTYEIDLSSTSLIFNRGHRIRVAISSSNYPRLEKNLNTCGAWPSEANEKPVVAHQTIVLGGAEASHIILPEVVGTGTSRQERRR